MATYQELFNIKQDTPTGLAEKITVGIAVKAHAIAIDPTSTAAENTWALSALRNPSADYGVVLAYILAANKTATVAQITGADDATVQGAVDSAVDQLLGA
jgi:hypothetical protein